MRKLLLTVLALVMLSSSCLAANWEWIHSNSEKGYFFDTDSIVFDTSPDKKNVNRDKFYVWVKIVFDPAYAKKKYQRDDIAYCIDMFGFDLADNKLCEKETIYYSNEKEVLLTFKDVTKWQNTIPESIGEHLMKHTGKYVRAHTEEIEQRTRGTR